MTSPKSSALKMAIELLRAEAARAQGEGDLATASVILYSYLPSIEADAALELIERLPSGKLVIKDVAASDQFIAVSVDAVDLEQPDEVFDSAEAELPISVSPLDTLAALRWRAEVALGRGDYRTASRIENELIPAYTNWLDEHRIFSFEEETSGGRLLLRDDDGAAWIAAKRDDL